MKANMNNLLADYKYKKMEHRAENYLIACRKCSTVRTDFYAHPCFGGASDTLSHPRKWLYEQLLAEGKSSEHAIIGANKTVLYVNEEELQKVTDNLIEEMLSEEAKAAVAK